MQKFTKEILSKKNPNKVTCSFKNENFEANSQNIFNEDIYRGMLETLNLVAIPGMREKLLEGMNEPLSDCVPEEEVQW